MFLFPTAGDSSGTTPSALPHPCKLDPITVAFLPEQQLAPRQGEAA